MVHTRASSSSSSTMKVQQQLHTGTRHTPFQKTAGVDEIGTPSAMILCSITAMPEYQQLSMEELRLQDCRPGLAVGTSSTSSSSRNMKANVPKKAASTVNDIANKMSSAAFSIASGSGTNPTTHSRARMKDATMSANSGSVPGPCPGHTKHRASPFSSPKTPAAAAGTSPTAPKKPSNSEQRRNAREWARQEQQKKEHGLVNGNFISNPKVTTTTAAASKVSKPAAVEQRCRSRDGTQPLHQPQKKARKDSTKPIIPVALVRSPSPAVKPPPGTTTTPSVKATPITRHAPNVKPNPVAKPTQGKPPVPAKTYPTTAATPTTAASADASTIPALTTTGASLPTVNPTSQTPTGRAVLLIQRISNAVSEFKEPTELGLELVGTDGLWKMLQKLFELQQAFQQQGIDPEVDLGWHYTSKENIKNIELTGLLTAYERQANKMESYTTHGRWFGDGIYTANNPSSFQKYGDKGILVARLKGGCSPRVKSCADLPQGIKANTIIGNKILEHDPEGEYDEVVLQSRDQIVPLVCFNKNAVDCKNSTLSSTLNWKTLFKARDTFQKIVNEICNPGQKETTATSCYSVNQVQTGKGVILLPTSAAVSAPSQTTKAQASVHGQTTKAYTPKNQPVNPSRGQQSPAPKSSQKNVKNNSSPTSASKSFWSGWMSINR